MGMFIIEVKDTEGGNYHAVGVEADTIKEAIEEYEKSWYNGIFSDPLYGIGEVKIKYIRNFSLKDKEEGTSYSELHDG
jgi:hypothetical protein